MGRSPAEVRRFVLANAAYWIEEFHFDGLRLDATQDIHDTSEEHILGSFCPPGPHFGWRPRHFSGGRERAAGYAVSPPGQSGRFWHRRALER